MQKCTVSSLPAPSDSDVNPDSSSSAAPALPPEGWKAKLGDNRQLRQRKPRQALHSPMVKTTHNAAASAASAAVAAQAAPPIGEELSTGDARSAAPTPAESRAAEESRRRERQSWVEGNRDLSQIPAPVGYMGAPAEAMGMAQRRRDAARGRATDEWSSAATTGRDLDVYRTE